MFYPKQFKKGDTIEIVAPSNGISAKDITKLEKAISYLEKKGYKVIEGKNVRKSKNGVSSSKKERALELNTAFKNKNSLLVIACSGGDYAINIFDLVNYNLLKKNPKWIEGHSDITSILYYITTKLDIATIYNFNCKRISRYDVFPTNMISNNMKLLNHKEIIQSEYKIVITDEGKKQSRCECITEEKNVKGRIIGGTLECLKDIIGTKYDYTKKFIKKYSSDGIIWYFDIYTMTNEDILRTMWQFKNSGWFDNTKAIVIGRLFEEKSFTGIDLKTALLDSLKDLNVPIIINADIGHTDPVISIVNGSIVEIKKDKYYTFKTFFE